MKYPLMALASLCAFSTPSFSSESTEITKQAEQNSSDIEREQPEHWSRLPFLGKKARELGYELPIPVGVGLYYNTQEVGYSAKDDFLLGLSGTGKFGWLDSNISIPSEDVVITGSDESLQLKIDAWVLPFLNIYGLVGHTKGQKNILADLSNAEGIPGGGIDIVLPIPLEYEAYNVGLGTVIAGQAEIIPGMHPFIFTGVAAFTNSWTTATDSKIQTYIGSVRVGQRHDVYGGKLAVMLGYNYQLINQKVTGSMTFDITSGARPSSVTVDYDVNLVSSQSHNMSVSMVYDFGPNNEWNIFAEYGFLNWDQLIVSVGRRF